ncbi:MAG: type II toxin-antitoxin system RelE/ParE family toxin [Crocosphaera sp.]
MNRYVINILVTQYFNQIADYFTDYDVEAGEKFFREFNQKCKQLVLFPKSGKSYDYIRQNLRGLSFTNYIIFYRILEEDIDILRVISGRRNLYSIFEDYD